MTKMKTSRDFGVIWKQNFSIKIVLGKVVTFSPKQKTSFKANINFIQRTPLPNPCRIEIKSGAQSKRCEIDRLLTKDFTQNFKERYHHKRKSRIKSEIWSPRRSTLGKISQRYEFIRIIWFFWRSYRGGKNCIFPWKSIWTDIFDRVWRNIFCWFFSRCLFFLSHGENTSGKNPAETQSMKIQVKSEKIPVRKNVVKIMQSQYSKFNHSKQGKRFEDIKK